MGPFCEGYYPNHRDLLLTLSLALFFSFLHLSGDMSFHNFSYTYSALFEDRIYLSFLHMI